jgi:8-oxo-dGTP pyrophosphatase MutT (NUDIX family)
MKITRRSSGVVILRAFEDGPRYLLLRCYSYWDFPKGEVEPGEDQAATARREVREETGLSDLIFRWGECFIETPPYSRGKVARYYVAECPNGEVYLPVSPELGVPEHQEFRWVRFEEALSLVNGRILAVLEWAIDKTKGPPRR